MPDLDIQVFAHCLSNEYWERKVQGNSGEYLVIFSRDHRKDRNADHDYFCSCPHFMRRLSKTPGVYCKHIDEVKDEHCGWMQFLHGGEPVDDKCPECGDDVDYMKWGT